MAARFIESASEEAPDPSPLEIMAEAWQYGYGEFDEMSNRVKAFQRLPHFTGVAVARRTRLARSKPRLGDARALKAATSATTRHTPQFAAGPRLAMVRSESKESFVLPRKRATACAGA